MVEMHLSPWKRQNRSTPSYLMSRPRYLKYHSILTRHSNKHTKYRETSVSVSFFLWWERGIDIFNLPSSHIRVSQNQ